MLVVLFALPLLVAALALVVDVGQLVAARARLQSIADRAATAGAAGLAHALDRVAAQNWKLHRAWRDLEEEFGRSSEHDRAAAQEIIRAYEGKRDGALATMNDAMAMACPRAALLARRLAAAHANDAAIEALAVGCSAIDNADRWERVEGAVVAAAMEGTSIPEPESVEQERYRGLRFLVRRSDPARVGVRLRRTVRPLLLPALVGEAVTLSADAVAQAYGGSVEAFAAKGTATLAEAEARLDAARGDALYRFALVPRWTMGEWFAEER